MMYQALADPEMTAEDTELVVDLVAQAALIRAAEDAELETVLPDLVNRVKDLREAKARVLRCPNLSGTTINFTQGISEAVALARVLALYRRRGISVAVSCSEHLEFLFIAAGIEIACHKSNDRPLFVTTGKDYTEASVDRYWTYNLSASLIGREPLPPLQEAPELLWAELVTLELDVSIPPHFRQAAAAYVRDLPRPLILISPVNEVSGAGSGIPRDATVDLYRHLLDNTSGTLLVADWDGPVPRFGNYRVRHMSDLWDTLDPLRMLALLKETDAVISVDGPLLHLASLTNVATVGAFLTPRTYPPQNYLPHANAVYLVPHDVCHSFNRKIRLQYHLVELPRGSVSQAGVPLAEACLSLLAAPRYLGANEKGADLVLQQFVLNWERGFENSLSGHVDRHRGYDFLLHEIQKRFSKPLLIETSTISTDESWRVDGYSTYLLGTFLDNYGGSLISIDPNADNLTFATKVLSEVLSVRLVTQSPAAYLGGLDRAIDVLLLNGSHPAAEGVAEECLSYVRAAEPNLHANSLIVIDDTPYFRGKFTGRGALATPWLLKRGWQILQSGYQTVCARKVE